MNKQRGIGIVEIIVALGLIAVAFSAVSTVTQFSIRTQRTLALRQRASLLAVEALEVTKFERDGSWSTFVGRAVDTDLYSEYVGMVAQLTTADPGAIDGLFTRTIRLSRVYRDMAGDIAVSGTEDTAAREVTVSVSWTDAFGALRVTTLSAYMLQI